MSQKAGISLGTFIVLAGAYILFEHAVSWSFGYRRGFREGVEKSYSRGVEIKPLVREDFNKDFIDDFVYVRKGPTYDKMEYVLIDGHHVECDGKGGYFIKGDGKTIAETFISPDFLMGYDIDKDGNQDLSITGVNVSTGRPQKLRLYGDGKGNFPREEVEDISGN